MLPSGHPGVYIQETPSTPTIVGAPTAIPLFVGVTELTAGIDLSLMGEPGVPYLITSWASYTRYFGGLVWGAYTAWAVYEFFQEGGSTCYVVSLADQATTQVTPATEGCLTFSPAMFGVWANFIAVAIRDAIPVPASTTGPSPFFTVSVMVDKTALDTAAASSDDAATKLAAQLLSAYIRNNKLKLEPDPSGGDDYWVTLESFGSFTTASLSAGTGGTSSSSSGGAMGAAVAPPIQSYVNARSMFIRITGLSDDLTRPDNNFGPGVNTLQPFTGGEAVNVSYDGTATYLSVNHDVSLLATPDLACEIDTTIQKTTINTKLEDCEKNNVFYVIDPPFYSALDATDPIQSILNFKMGYDATPALASEYGALYFSWILVLNPITNVMVPIPPSGTVLGRYANTDYIVGVHKSPAGTRDGLMSTVAGMTTAVSDSDQDLLNPHGINALRTLVGYGNLIYGARTLAIGTDYTYVAVRRFVSFVERSLRNNLQWLVFEPNRQDLWMMAKSEVEAFLNVQWQQGALFGSTAAEAFYVVCDATNNPPEDRALGVLCVDVGLAVVYPSEFVLIRITQKSGSPNV